MKKMENEAMEMVNENSEVTVEEKKHPIRDAFYNHRESLVKVLIFAAGVGLGAAALLGIAKAFSDENEQTDGSSDEAAIDVDSNVVE